MSDMKLFGEYDLSEVKVKDISLEPYINLKPVISPLSYGRNIKKQFWKSKKPIVERLICKLMVSGHKGKKHWRTSNIASGKTMTIYSILRESFGIIEQKTKKNPIQVLIEAIENGSPREGITAIEYGGVRYPKPVEISPQRRVDLALRWIAQGAYAASSGAKTGKSLAETLANELISASKNDSTASSAVRKKVELEKQANASR